MNELYLKWMLGGLVLLFSIMAFLIAMYGDRIQMLDERLYKIEEKLK